MLTALYANEHGEIFDAPGWEALGRIGGEDYLLASADMIPLPEGAELMYLPGHTALGGRSGKLQQVKKGHCLAVAAMLPVGYTRTYLPSYLRDVKAPQLPLFGYTAAALYRDQIYVAAVKSDDNHKWQPYKYNTPDLPRRISKVKKELKDNRLVAHLADCSLQWHCCTAQNLFYHRWEAGIPVSQVCNANCFGCISLQASECCPSPQSRIRFAPAPEEVAQIGIYHLSTAPEAIVSFGQGCEGEPSLAADTIVAAIKQIRGRTSCGVININTNAGYTEGIKKITDSGLNSMRVSIISAREDTYQAYYRSNYTLREVKASIAYAKAKGVYISLNMLSFPGLNDRPEEITAWKEFIAETGIDMIQLRNLNIDPDSLWKIMPAAQEKPLGVKAFIHEIRKTFPKLQVGSFSHYLDKE